MVYYTEDTRKKNGDRPKTILSFIAFLLLLIGSGSASAAPFHYTPQSFVSWFNKLNYSIKLISVDRCSYRKEKVGETYACSGGFATINDPLGKRVCPVSLATWVRRFDNPSLGGSGASVIEKECRWKN